MIVLNGYLRVPHERIRFNVPERRMLPRQLAMLSRKLG